MVALNVTEQSRRLNRWAPSADLPHRCSFSLTAFNAMVDSIDPSLDRHINRSLLNEVRVERLDFEKVAGIGFPKLLLDLLSRGFWSVLVEPDGHSRVR